MQQKDVIYIDVEDDITAIISKVKGAKEKIVALVPPKRTGVLQSAVNLRLLNRAADEANKRLVLITHNAALTSLAASAEIPVAKNLHSKPEIVKAPAVEDDEEDVIDGEKLPVGAHARMSSRDDDKAEAAAVASSINDLDIDGEAASAAPTRVEPEEKAKAKKGIKVPDFGTFRKKMIWLGAGGVLLIAFLVWAMVFAPRATIVVSARTIGQTLTVPVTLGTDVTTDSEDNTIKIVEQQDKQTQTVEFDATGSKNVGEKAEGSIKFSNSSTSPRTVPAGTVLTTNGGLSFTLDSSVSVPAGSVNCPTIFTCSGVPGEATGSVTATEGGAKYNSASGSLSGSPSGISTTFTSPTSGGTDKTVPMVTQADVEKAKEQLAEQSKDDAKDKLQTKFKDNYILIENSFTSEGGDPTSSPDIGQEAASGKAKLTSEITFKMSAVAKDEMNAYLDEAFDNILANKEQQRVYDNGAGSVKFDDFKAGEKTATATLIANAQIGPKINDDNLKEQAKGKRVGEVIGDIKAIDGVSDVNVKLSPFWVSGVPDDTKKISIEFKLIKND